MLRRVDAILSGGAHDPCRAAGRERAAVRGGVDADRAARDDDDAGLRELKGELVREDERLVPALARADDRDGAPGRAARSS